MSMTNFNNKRFKQLAGLLKEQEEHDDEWTRSQTSGPDMSVKPYTKEENIEVVTKMYYLAKNLVDDLEEYKELLQAGLGGYDTEELSMNISDAIQRLNEIVEGPGF